MWKPDKSIPSKLKSFTVLELLITILISTVLMALTLYTLTSFQKINQVYGLQQQTLYRLMTLHRLIGQDFSKSKIIRRTRNGILIESKNQTVEYTFSKENYITRKQGRETEEFEFEAAEVKLSYKNKPTFLYEEVIDEMRFEIEIENEILPFHFYKSYASDVLMENEQREN